MATAFVNDSAWRQVKIGAGGWVTGIDIHKDGTTVVRTDTAGAYLWNGSAWEHLVTTYTMPADTPPTAGVYEIRIAPSDSNIFYMEAAGNIYKSIDRGGHWTKTSFANVFMDANAGNRMDGQKMAIDPNNPNIVFAGTQKNGLWVTRDGGTNWQRISDVPQGASTGQDTGLTGIVINKGVLYVGTAGSGVFRSADSGVSWQSIPGGPVDVSHAAISPNGELYVTGNTDGSLWKFVGGTWTKVIAGGDVQAVAIDPFNASHIVVVDGSGRIQESDNAGTSWSGWNYNPQLESSNDIPWLENSGKYMSAGGIVFDPITPNKLYQSAGVGVWHTMIPDTMTWGTPVVWNSQSAGIENLVPNDIIAPKGGNPVFASWDRAFVEMADVDSYATTYGGGGFSMGWSVDYASSDPAFIVGISDYWGTENSGYSTDGGRTWQKFAGLPSFALTSIGGSIAASSPTNFIWAPAANTAPAYTLDGGKTWASINIPGKTDWSGFHHAYYLKRTTITADRVDPKTFYLYDVDSGVYVTRDGGVNWNKVFSGPVSDWSYWNAKIEAVPGKAGELYFSSGPLDGDPFIANVGFMHSKDGGATWQAVANVKEVTSFSYGAPQVAGGPATVFLVGFVNNEYGIWYSTDESRTWTQIGRNPMGSLDSIVTISGDMDQFGKVYVGLNGSGYVHLSFGADGASTPTTAVPPPSQTVSITGAIDDVGVPATGLTDTSMNDATPTLQGALSALLTAGQSIVVYRDGQKIGTVSTTTLSWSFADPGAVDGRHIYTAQIQNQGGQNGSISGGFSVTVDTAAPVQRVSIISAVDDVGPFTGALSNNSTTDDVSPTIKGLLSSALGQGETIALFRDGVRLGSASLVEGGWSFTDSNAGSGIHRYTARVEDAAGNAGVGSSEFVLSMTAMSELNGTWRNDNLIGSGGSDRISGLPEGPGKLGKGTADTLTGGAGADLFILGDARGIFYNDGSARTSGASDYALITDFSASDKIQLSGTASDYFQSQYKVNGASGTGIFHDTNDNGIFDSRDEFIALVQNHDVIALNNLIFI